MATESKDLDVLKALGSVTLKDVWDHVKWGVPIWAALTGLEFAVGAIIPLKEETADSWIKAQVGAVPKWLWWPIGWAVATWFIRGKHINFTLPASKFLWALLSFQLFLIVACCQFLPHMAALAVINAVMTAMGVLGFLIDLGAQNLAERKTKA